MKETKYFIFVIVILLLCVTANGKNKMKNEIYFAGGCFWGTEHFLKQINGVIDTQVGYANGKGTIINPTYNQVCNNNTGFAETVKVEYDPAIVSLETLIELFLKTIDPTTLNKQGNDYGTQYRSGIYFSNPNDKPIIQNILNNISKNYSKPVVVEVNPIINFYKAEEYHQEYLIKHPGGYCHISPDLFEYAKKANAPKVSRQTNMYKKTDDAVLRSKLTPMQYAVTKQNATERAFNNEYWDEKRDGIYVDITTGEPLFVSTDKFDSGCGWPSFSKPIDNSLIEEKIDRSYGMTRTEVRSKTGDAHLGHLFTDGPSSRGGLRYCINSAALRFIPKDKMQEEGYGKYLPLLENN